MIDRTQSLRGLCLLALCSLLIGCGGGSSGSVAGPTAGTNNGPNGPGGTTNPPSNTPATIQGVATPSSVAVVTATNAD